MKEPLKFTLRNTMYPYPVLFWCGALEPKQLPAWFKKERVGQGGSLPDFDPMWDDGAACFDLGDAALVWVPKQSDGIEEAGALAHEIAHAVFFAGETLGFSLSVADSAEFYCYFIQFLTEGAYRHIFRRKNTPA